MLYSPISINAILLLFGHGLLIAGYLQQALVGIRTPSTSLPAPTNLGAERWLWLLYTGGLMLLFAAMFLIAGPDPAFFKLPDRIIQLLPGVLIGIIAIGLDTLFNRRLPILQRGISALVDFLQLRWLFRLFDLALIGAGKLLHLPNLLLEGQAGLIWAILLLVLLLTIFAQSGVPSQIGSGG